MMMQVHSPSLTSISDSVLQFFIDIGKFDVNFLDQVRYSFYRHIHYLTRVCMTVSSTLLQI